MTLKDSTLYNSLMSAVPKRRISHRRKNNRRSHDALKLPNFGVCPDCKAQVMMHNACTNCGKYKGKAVLPI